MDSKKVKSKDKIRLIIAALFAALSNGYLKGFAKGEIYEGKLKYLCAPGLNCYSCPGAVLSCPIGALQSVLSGRGLKFSLYVVGFIAAIGTVFGRFVCGFLCPFGLIQDLLNKIPFFKKIKKLPGEKTLRFLRYIILAVFVVILPLLLVDATGLGKPWFCKFICPAGTLEGGTLLVALNKSLRSAVGFLYTYKLIILGITVLASIIIYRPFCRYICPLGAIYGLFNKISLLRYEIDTDKCTKCNTCVNTCEFGIDVFKNPNSIDCIRCGKCKTACPANAIQTVFIVKKKEKNL